MAIRCVLTCRTTAVLSSSNAVGRGKEIRGSRFDCVLCAHVCLRSNRPSFSHFAPRSRSHPLMIKIWCNVSKMGSFKPLTYTSTLNLFTWPRSADSLVPRLYLPNSYGRRNVSGFRLKISAAASELLARRARPAPLIHPHLLTVRDVTDSAAINVSPTPSIDDPETPR